jgi:hypothetical protein
MVSLQLALNIADLDTSPGNELLTSGLLSFSIAFWKKLSEPLL